MESPERNGLQQTRYKQNQLRNRENDRKMFGTVICRLYIVYEMSGKYSISYKSETKRPF